MGRVHLRIIHAMDLANPDLRDLLLMFLGPYDVTRLAICNKQLRDAYLSEAENYGSFRLYGRAIRFLFSMSPPPVLSAMLIVFEDYEGCVERVKLAPNGSFQTFQKTLARVVHQHKGKGGQFSVVVVHEQRNMIPMWAAQYRVYASSKKLGANHACRAGICESNE